MTWPSIIWYQIYFVRSSRVPDGPFEHDKDVGLIRYSSCRKDEQFLPFTDLLCQLFIGRHAGPCSCNLYKNVSIWAGPTNDCISCLADPSKVVSVWEFFSSFDEFHGFYLRQPLLSKSLVVNYAFKTSSIFIISKVGFVPIGFHQLVRESTSSIWKQ